MKFWEFVYLTILPLTLLGVQVFLCFCTDMWMDCASVPVPFLARVLFLSVWPYNGALILVLFSLLLNPNF